MVRDLRQQFYRPHLVLLALHPAEPHESQTHPRQMTVFRAVEIGNELFYVLGLLTIILVLVDGELAEEAMNVARL